MFEHQRPTVIATVVADNEVTVLVVLLAATAGKTGRVLLEFVTLAAPGYVYVQDGDDVVLSPRFYFAAGGTQYIGSLYEPSAVNKAVELVAVVLNAPSGTTVAVQAQIRTELV